jgi:hypothetical protein
MEYGWMDVLWRSRIISIYLRGGFVVVDFPGLMGKGLFFKLCDCFIEADPIDMGPFISGVPF